MSSRRGGKAVRDPFGGAEDMTMREAADLIYGDPDMVDDLDRQRPEHRPVHPDELEIDSAIQVRVNGLDPARVEELKQVLLNGGSFKDPNRAYRDDDGKLWLSAGFRRTEATRLALLEAPPNVTIAPLICDIFPGGREAAIEDAENDNLKHGEPLSQEDKRLIFTRRMVREHEWFTEKFSNRKIAAELAVSEGTIRNWLKTIPSLTAQDYAVRETEGKKGPEKRVGADGRNIRVDRIRKAAQKRTTMPRPTPPPEPAYDDEGLPDRHVDDETPGWHESPAAVPSDDDDKRWIMDQLHKLAGMLDRFGRPGDARVLRGVLSALAREWGRK